MISRVQGTLLRRETDAVEVMTAGGIAYEIRIPLSVYERLPRTGEDVELYTYQVVREDALTLYGFADPGERSVFARLLAASGVGPRLAQSMLSHLPADALVRAISERDTDALRQVPGIGKKTAERLSLDLADRLDDLAVAAASPSPASRAAEEAIGALVALGYSTADAGKAVRSTLEDADDALEGPALIKAALTRLGT